MICFKWVKDGMQMISLENVKVPVRGEGQRDRDRSPPILAEVEVQPHWISTAHESDPAS